MIDAVFFDKLKIILKIINKTESGNCVIAGNTPLAPPCGIPNPSTVVHLGEEAKTNYFLALIQSVGHRAVTYGSAT